jgi:tetratricopeptide (TPR) repeat protein
MTKLRVISLLAAALMPVTLMPVSLPAQTPAAATIHGHVQNAAGMPIPKSEVRLTTDKSSEFKNQKFKYTFPIDASGDYKGEGIAPGDYLVIVVSTEKSVDFQNLVVKAGDDKVVNFDMTRKEYIDKMTPEEKTALEEYKKHVGESKVIANLNNALKQVRDDLASKSPNYDEDIKTMQQATAQKPDEAVLWLNLGQVQLAQADAAMKQAKADHKPWQSDETILKMYGDGIASYKKGIDVNSTAKKPIPGDAGIAWNSIGTAEAKLGKIPEATEAFENAVKIAPATAGMVYGNEAAVLFNAGQNDAAGAAAEKAIAADPTKPDPYYVKGQSLIAKATVDKAGKISAPAGCAEAYQKYLELAPDGAHAQEARDILTGMGQTVNTKYRAPGKK